MARARAKLNRNRTANTRANSARTFAKGTRRNVAKAKRASRG